MQFPCRDFPMRLRDSERLDRDIPDRMNDINEQSIHNVVDSKGKIEKLLHT
jgi:hypothetical protein